MPTIKLTEKQIEEALGVKLIDVNHLNWTFYKYIRWDFVEKMLNEGKAKFVYPKIWNDPYERKYLETDFSELGYVVPPIFCFCVRNDNENEEASWKIYKPSEKDKLLVRLSINAGKFL